MICIADSTEAPFALKDTDFEDDHGDTAEIASAAIPGQSISGQLDHLFDFDYFRFQVQKGQRYQIGVQHPSHARQLGNPLRA